MERREKKLESNPYLRLRRAYCRKYGLNPLTARIPKSELIADAAYDTLTQNEPELPPADTEPLPSPDLFFRRLKEYAQRRKAE